MVGALHSLPSEGARLAPSTKRHLDETTVLSKRLPIETQLRKLPIAAVASIVDSAIFTAAIRDVRRGRAFRYWGRI
jgi:hypothetical protein